MGQVRRFGRLRGDDPQARPLEAGAPARPHRLRRLINLAMALLLVALLAFIVAKTDWRSARDAAGRLAGRVMEALV